MYSMYPRKITTETGGQRYLLYSATKHLGRIGIFDVHWFACSIVSMLHVGILIRRVRVTLRQILILLTNIPYQYMYKWC